MTTNRRVIAVASRGPEGGVSVSGLLRQALLNHGSGNHIVIATNKADSETDEPMRTGSGTLDVRLVSISDARWAGYNPGWSNTVLWGNILAPHMPFTTPDATTLYEWWSAYKSVNWRMASFVVKALKEPGNENAVVIAHDYHMFRVGRYVKKIIGREMPDMRVPPLGLFVHLPWPKPEVFAKCPNAREIVEGMLDYDCVMFHTQTFVDNFTQTALNFGLVVREGQVRANPASLDPSYWARLVPQEPYPKPMPHPGCKVILAVERVEPVKGALERLTAFKSLLRRNPEWRGKVQLFQAGVNPNDPRLGILAYRYFLSQIDAKIGSINALYGNAQYKPVQTLPWFTHAELMWVYQNVADVLVVSSRTDGMNLVIQEAVSMGEKPPVLAPLISKHAGAAEFMSNGDNGAVVFNPLSVASHRKAMLRALKMNSEERRKRAEWIRARVAAHTVHDWHKLLVERTVEQSKKRPSVVR